MPNHKKKEKKFNFESQFIMGGLPKLNDQNINIRRLQIKNGIKPLIISKKRTISAKNLFPVRKTFVAPTLPEPMFLISPNPDNFVNISAKGANIACTAIHAQAVARARAPPHVLSG